MQKSTRQIFSLVRLIICKWAPLTEGLIQLGNVKSKFSMARASHFQRPHFYKFIVLHLHSHQSRWLGHLLHIEQAQRKLIILINFISMQINTPASLISRTMSSVTSVAAEFLTTCKRAKFG